jgi:hypothetical protein
MTCGVAAIAAANSSSRRWFAPPAGGHSVILPDLQSNPNEKPALNRRGMPNHSDAAKLGQFELDRQ